MASAEPSIAVLPFSNLSPEPEDYFSDGLTEEIIHALSSVRGIRVVARTSAFALKYKHADVPEVGRALNVGFVLEGSVRKSKKAPTCDRTVGQHHRRLPVMVSPL
jgi:TolB-like protein